jgi:hypothetical protein
LFSGTDIQVLTESQERTYEFLPITRDPWATAADSEIPSGGGRTLEGVWKSWSDQKIVKDE